MSSKKYTSLSSKDINELDLLYTKTVSHIDQARANVQRTVDAEMIKAYWLIGRDIIQEEQSGQLRAKYGRSIIKQLSKKLQQRYKRGFSVQTLEKARKFYVLYQQDPIGEKSPTASGISQTHAMLNLNLSWSHYVELITVKRDEARDFYALEASQNKWTVRELRRQMDSFLYDRLAKAKDKDQVLQLAHKGQEINKPEDAIKEPLVLEFLGVPEPHKLSETKLESALINNFDSVAIFAKDFRPSLPPKIGKNDATANCFCRGRPRHQHFARYACYVLALRWLYGCIKICRASLRAVLQIAAYHGLPNFASLSCWVAAELLIRAWKRFFFCCSPETFVF